ncbi:UDP-N-acetylglucosamine 2-epimerase [Phaeosphaeriaceae sp. PMI808]|nr:UDP-N-acetylglucosamine 2-epimerase [Phaeosphaeriaceae sp. PMI808]
MPSHQQQRRLARRERNRPRSTQQLEKTRKLNKYPESRKSLLFITSTRADFGKLAPLAHAAKEAGYFVRFFVTGMHMMKKFGKTKHDIYESEVDSVHEFINQAPGDSQAVILSKTVLGLSDYIQENRPDLLIAHGDRIEAFAACFVSATNSIRCAHVEGGELSGSIDDSYRHCNSKLSIYHFVSSEDARRRVISLGEKPGTVFNIGSPELDIHAYHSSTSLEDVKRRHGILFDRYGIVIFHSVTSETQTIGEQFEQLFSCLTESGKDFLLIYPNNDQGCDQIFEKILQLDKKKFFCLPSVPFRDFSVFMANAQAIVGNSSAGVREAPFLGVPSLNIGTRQQDRAKAASITHASAFDVAKIQDFLNSNWGKKFARDESFGAGDAARQFVKALSQDEFWDVNLQKYFYRGF